MKNTKIVSIIKLLTVYEHRLFSRVTVNCYVVTRGMTCATEIWECPLTLSYDIHKSEVEILLAVIHWFYERMALLLVGQNK